MNSGIDYVANFFLKAMNFSLRNLILTSWTNGDLFLYFPLFSSLVAGSVYR